VFLQLITKTNVEAQHEVKMKNDFLSPMFYKINHHGQPPMLKTLLNSQQCFPWDIRCYIVS